MLFPIHTNERGSGATEQRVVQRVSEYEGAAKAVRKR